MVLAVPAGTSRALTYLTFSPDPFARHMWRAKGTPVWDLWWEEPLQCGWSLPRSLLQLWFPVPTQ